MSSFDSPLPVHAPADTHTAAEAGPAKPLRPIAPLWHTIVLLAFILLMSLHGSSAVTSADAGKHTNFLYLQTIAIQWLMFAYIAWGLRRGGVRMRDLIGGRWNSPEDFLLDFVIAIGFMITAFFVLGGLNLAVTTIPCFLDRAHHGLPMFANGGVKAALDCALKGRTSSASRLINFLGPKTGLQLLLGLCVCVTAGIVEETTFRGYLQRQFGALAGRAWIGLIASALVFGLAHGYEGPSTMFVIFVFGAMFGVVAMWRNSLRPGMMTHAMFDAIQMIFLFLFSSGAVKIPS
jgi:membrane protease YdiL (CAAX protease family)